MKPKSTEVDPIISPDEEQWETVYFSGEDPEKIIHTIEPNTDNCTELITFGLNIIPDTPKKKKKKSKKRKKRIKKKAKSKVSDIALFFRDVFDSVTSQASVNQVPDYMKLIVHRDSGVLFGRELYCGINQYIGKPQDCDGHCLIVGGQGSGKSSGSSIPTLETYNGVIVALDPKGELATYWEDMKKAKRPCKIFNPDNIHGVSYDTLHFIRCDDRENLFSNVYELVQAIIPLSYSGNDDFWKKAARKILIAVILYYLDLNLTFVEILKSITNRPISRLIKEIGHSTNPLAKSLVSSYLDMDDLSESKMLMDVSEELNIHIMEFIADTRIQNALTPREDCIRWDEDAITHNVFLSIPESKLNQWGSVIILMLTQLIRSLERRPEKYSAEGQKLPPVLLLLDEFPRFGKLDAIADALSTLRSKNVTFCLLIQSLAQLDYIYGEHVRKIILDNCSYKAILNVSDADSQKYFSELAGTSKSWSRSYSESFNPLDGEFSYSRNISESREAVIQPHELATLNDNIILLTPEGYCQVQKAPYYNQSLLL